MIRKEPTMKDIFGLDTPAGNGDGMSLLTTTYDNAAKDIIEALLRSENIPFVSKDRGVGGSLRVITGFSIYGCDIYVNNEMLDTAKELLEAFLNSQPVEEDNTDPDDQ